MRAPDADPAGWLALLGALARLAGAKTPAERRRALRPYRRCPGCGAWVQGVGCCVARPESPVRC